MRLLFGVTRRQISSSNKTLIEFGASDTIELKMCENKFFSCRLGIRILGYSLVGQCKCVSAILHLIILVVKSFC